MVSIHTEVSMKIQQSVDIMCHVDASHPIVYWYECSLGGDESSADVHTGEAPEDGLFETTATSGDTERLYQGRTTIKVASPRFR